MHHVLNSRCVLYKPMLGRVCVTQPAAQQGMALIAVLFVVLLISILGAVAMRQGLTGLRLATSEQLAKSHVAMNENVWRMIQREVSDKDVGASALGVVHNAQATEFEVVFCYKPLKRQKIFDFTDFQVVGLVSSNTVNTESKTGLGLTTGFCDINDSAGASYNAKRQISMTQISARRLAARDTSLQLDRQAISGSVFGNRPEGTGITEDSQTIYPVRFVITTLTPGVSSASKSDVQTCLTARYADNLDVVGSFKPESITECLSRIGVPSATNVGELTLRS